MILSKLIKEEADERMKIWMRVRIGREQMTKIGKELGYADGSGIHQAVKRLESLAGRDKKMKQKMERYMKCQVSRVDPQALVRKNPQI